MKDRLKPVLNHIVSFDDAELDRIMESFHLKTFRRNEIILHEGDACQEFYFVQKGCIRIYFLDRKGSERTRYIMQDNWIGTALTSFISQKPSVEWIEALEDSELLCISRKDFYRWNEESAAWQRFYQRILEMAYSFQNTRIETLVTLSAKERYLRVFQENPALIQRVSNKVLASYLDINPETLSRLKSR